MPDRETLAVSLGDRSYDIVIGSGLLAKAGMELKTRLGLRPVRIVADETPAKFYLPPLLASLKEAGFAVGDPVLIPSGEASKQFSRFGAVCETLLASKIDRSTVLIALGGGVTGDLAGFAAAVLLRGLDYVQIPTTLLSQVDSSVGGKTAIDTDAGKNLVGAFHQPRLVLADISTLDTLPRRELLGGYAEIVKHGLIVDAAYYAWLEANAVRALDGDTAARIDAIRRSCEIKADIVARDEREQGDRALLNFGHTFGHAMEALTGYGPILSHGEAVAIGSIMALNLSVRLGYCPAGDRDRVVAHYRNVGLPVAVPPSLKLTPEAIMAAMQTDKKNRSGDIRFVLTRGIGKAFAGAMVDRPLLEDFLAISLSEQPDNFS
jgi:3-dehydroquinate synthase